MRLSKKGLTTVTMFTTGLIAALLSMVVILVIIIGFGDQFSERNMDQIICWGSNSIKCGGGALYFMPDLCASEPLEESIDKEDLATIIRDTWWMFKEGECDFGSTVDEITLAYAFKAKEDIDLNDFFQHILTHNRGEEEDDPTLTDYNYLEKNTQGLTLCFDARDPYINNKQIKAGERYYIIFYDDQSQDMEDRVLISPDPQFDQEHLDILVNTAGCLTYGSANV